MDTAVYDKRQADKAARDEAKRLAAIRCKRLPGFTVPTWSNVTPAEGGHFVEVMLWVPTPKSCPTSTK